MLSAEGLREDDLKLLPPEDVAAITARSRWIQHARRKQIPPEGNWHTLLWLAGRFFGKALATTEPVPTPQGWTSMGDLVAGDTVFDETGAPCRVTHAWPVMLGRPCWRLTFDDGTQIVADSEHEWRVYDNAGWHSRKTDQIAGWLPILRQEVPTRDRGPLGIAAMDYIPSVPVRCIAVDSPSHLFLVSKSMIATHNSRSLVEAAWWEAYQFPNLRIHALAPTFGDVRRTIFEGESGFLSKVPPELIKEYNKTLGELTFVNGSRVYGFGVVDEADRLRGPQCHALIFDEAAASDRPAGNLEAAYRVASLGCRLPHPDGKTPARRLIATTPRPLPFLRNLIKRPGVITVRGTSYENLKNVSASIQSDLLALEGTTYGRQELLGEILDDNEHAIFKRSWFRMWPGAKKFPEFTYVVQTMDTAMEDDNVARGNKKDPDYSACAILGIFNTKQCFTEKELQAMGVRSKYAALLCDFWMERLGFPELLEKTRESYRTKYGKAGSGRRPDVVLIENQQSGISLRQVMSQYGVPVAPTPTRGQSKTMRAHSISPMIMQGMLFFPEADIVKFPYRKGLFRSWCEPLLEQMCAFAGEGTTEFDDGLDAIVHGMQYLMESGYFHAEPLRHKEDPDEVEERQQREAIAARDKEQRAEKGSWYG